MTARSVSKFAFILHADIAGSTSLVQLDERMAHERIQAAFLRLSKTVAEFGGVTREVRGDALLAEFDKASNAVSAALSFQMQNRSVNSRSADKINPDVRIGIAMGEVIIAENTVTGACAVLAQRLEQLAAAGSVVIQGAARESVPQRMPFEYRHIGEHEVKGFDRPVPAFEVSLADGKVLPEPDTPLPEAAHKTASRTRRRAILLASVTAAILVAGGIGWWQAWRTEPAPASVARMAHPLPDRPSLAVLPFHNEGNDPEENYLGDGISEGLITALSRLPDILVISRYSSSSFRGDDVRPQSVAEALGVRYVVSGQFERAKDALRLRVTLVDAIEGERLWSERFERSFDDYFTLRNQLTAKIVSSLSQTVSEEQRAALTRLYSGDIVAYDLFLRGESLIHRYSRDDNTSAREMYLRAIERDAEFARAWASVAMTYYFDIHFRWNIADKTLDRASDAAQTAVGLSEELPQAHLANGFVSLAAGRVDVAIRSAERAIAHDPNNADAYLLLGMARSLTGQTDTAIESIRHAKRLNPRPPSIYEMAHGRALLLAGRFEDARFALRRAVELNAGYLEAHVYLAATVSLLGDADEARRLSARVRSIDPGFNARTWLTSEFPDNAAPTRNVRDALAEIGLLDANEIVEDIGDGPEAVEQEAPATGEPGEQDNPDGVATGDPEDTQATDRSTGEERGYLETIRGLLRGVTSGAESPNVPDETAGRK